jgi:DNA primase
VIDRITIDKILDASNIVDVVSEFVSLRRRGVNYIGICPFHADNSPSFYVSPAKNICKCFSCGEGGTAVHFIMKHEQLSYAEALKFLAKKYNIEVKERELSDVEKVAQGDRESMLVVNSWAEKYFITTLHERPEGQSIGLRYFRERGFRDDIIRKFRLGYSLDERNALYREALRNGYRKEFLEKTGLIIACDNGDAIDRFRGRVIFPVHTLSGKVVAFGGRILKKDEKTAKYVNSPESEVYHKSNELYGIFFARKSITQEKHCFLVEGYTDVISMHQAGIENVVASSGTALTHGQIRLIRRFTENITVLYDGDAAGIKAALRGIDILLEEGMKIKIVLLPDGDDPDSFARKHNSTQFVEFIRENETDFIRFKTRLLLSEAGSDPIRRASIITDVVHTVAIVPDNIARSVYIKECSSMMEIKEEVLLHEVNKLRIAKNETPQHKPAASVNYEPLVEDTISESAALKPVARFPFDTHELTLLKYVVRYGEHVLDEYADKETGELTVIRVAEYISRSLAEDNMQFQTPLYERMLSEAVEHAAEAGFATSRYFLAHPDPEISRFAAELVNDRYLLSKYHSKHTPIPMEEDQLIHLVPYDIFGFKDACIRHRIDLIDERIRQIQQDEGGEEVMALMAEKTDLNNIKKSLNKLIGERIILKM